VADIVVTMLPDGAVAADALLNWGSRRRGALGELGPAADQSKAHRAWWAEKLSEQ